MYNIKFIIINNNTVDVYTKDNLSRNEYDITILQYLHSSRFCDITYDSSYTTILVREK